MPVQYDAVELSVQFEAFKACSGLEPQPLFKLWRPLFNIWRPRVKPTVTLILLTTKASLVDEQCMKWLKRGRRGSIDGIRPEMTRYGGQLVKRYCDPNNCMLAERFPERLSVAL
ncbi:hypothetical protein ABBQ32_008926 [Trebouxia sp. C0010 RCD-2024]